MKLMIDISDKLWKWINDGFVIDDEENLVSVVKNGIPLEESEDCVNRQAVLDLIGNPEFWDYRLDLLDCKVKKLPPVIPKQSKAIIFKD